MGAELRDIIDGKNIALSLKHLSLYLTTFACGAIVMVLELAGARVFSPYLGGSIPVWSALIGVILASIAIGLWIGGVAADRGANLERLGKLIVFAALWVMFTGLVHPTVLRFISTSVSSIQMSAFLCAIVLFAPAALSLGAINPWLIKVTFLDEEHCGRTVAFFNALSTVGSIIGTFLAGFWLFSFFGSTVIIFGCSTVLAVLALLIAPVNLWPIKVVLLVCAGMLTSGFFQPTSLQAGIIEFDTKYNRVRIEDSVADSSGVIRRLMLDPFVIQGSVNLNELSKKPGEKRAFTSDPYAKLFLSAESLCNKKINRALLIGGGAMLFPRGFVQNNPTASIDVVEIDGELFDMARRYFAYEAHPRINTIVADGRSYLNRSEVQYDTIFIDVFSSGELNPFELLTQEAITRENQVLNTNGCVLINLISAREGPAALVRDVRATYSSVFPGVEVVLLQPQFPAQMVQSMVIVARKSEGFTSLNIPPSLHRLLSAERGCILTDDFAPIDTYRVEIIKKLRVG